MDGRAERSQTTQMTLTMPSGMEISRDTSRSKMKTQNSNVDATESAGSASRSAKHLKFR